jgi:membrane fusion protein (multidrug efflux system)
VVRPLLTALLAIGVAGCGAAPIDESAEVDSVKEAVSVEVVTLRYEPISLEVALTGQLEAEFDVVIKPELDGTIRSIEFEEGQPAKKGALLFQLGDLEQRARLHEAQAAERLARDVYERTQRLANQDISSIARRAEATAALDEARAKIEFAQLQLDRTRIVAPFDGVLGSLMVGPGERVEPDIGLVEISAIDKLQLLFPVPEISIRLAKIGATIHARVASFPGERFAGEIFFISPTMDRGSRRLLLKAWIANDDHRLKPGMFANVDIVVFEKEAALMVPEASMVYDRSGIYVWRVDAEGLAEKIPVEIGIRQRGRVEVLEGLAEMDRVISAGVNKVMAGSLIDAVPAAGLAPAADEAAVTRAGEEKGGEAAERSAGAEG